MGLRKVIQLGTLAGAAKELLDYAGDKRVFLFYGEMGAGKTTLIKAICNELGVIENTSSPTFSIVNEYDSAQGVIYHFDFYRIREEIEAFDMGYEEYFYSGNYCFVEWPDKIASLLPDDKQTIVIHLQVCDVDSRQLSAF